MNRENLEKLLSWLNSDQEPAEQKYEKIRQRLIKFFISHSCIDAEDLADKTIDRVANKCSEVIEHHDGKDPTYYFLGVARRVYLESLRKRPEINYENQEYFVNPETENAAEIKQECLDDCLDTLPPDQRELILEFYEGEKRNKIDHRKRLAERLGIELNALRIRAHRIRNALHACILKCVSAKST